MSLPSCVEPCCHLYSTMSSLNWPASYGAPVRSSRPPRPAKPPTRPISSAHTSGAPLPAAMEVSSFWWVSSKPSLMNLTLIFLVLFLLKSVTAYLRPSSQNQTVILVLPSTSWFEMPAIGVPAAAAPPPADPPVPPPSVLMPAQPASDRAPTAAALLFRNRRRLSGNGLLTSSIVIKLS